MKQKLLRAAKRRWKNNEVLPLDLFAALVECGVDVERLEQRYLRYE